MGAANVTSAKPRASAAVASKARVPARRTHALQVEINRALYMDEATRIANDGFARLSRDIGTVTARLAGFDWSALR